MNATTMHEAAMLDAIAHALTPIQQPAAIPGLSVYEWHMTGEQFERAFGPTQPADLDWPEVTV